MWVHLEGAEGLRLEENVPGGGWLPVCAAPCDQAVFASHSYRIAGDLVRASAGFGLVAPAGGREGIRVRRASQVWFVAGLAMAGVGGAAWLVGGLYLYLGALGVVLSPLAETTPKDGASSFDPTPLVAIGAGLLVGAVGGVVAALNRESTARQKLEAPSGVAPVERGPVRAPSLSHPALERSLPAAASFPVLAGVF